MEMFKIVKVQKINPVTYLLENYHRKPIAGEFYEYEYRVVNLHVSNWKGIV